MYGENPHAFIQTNHQYRFSLNVWMGRSPHWSCNTSKLVVRRCLSQFFGEKIISILRVYAFGWKIINVVHLTWSREHPRSTRGGEPASSSRGCLFSSFHSSPSIHLPSPPAIILACSSLFHIFVNTLHSLSACIVCARVSRQWKGKREL